MCKDDTQSATGSEHASNTCFGTLAINPVHVTVAGGEGSCNVVYVTSEPDLPDDPPSQRLAAPPRIPPLEIAEADDHQLELLEPLGGDEALNLFRTLAHHSKLLRSWLPFGGRLLRGGALPERDRELVILRVAWLCGSDYEWGQHVAIARDAGLTDPEILRIAAAHTGSESDPEPDRSRHEALLSAAVDQLVADHMIDSETWTGLADTYDDTQMIELTMLAGHYAMLAGTLNSIGVQPENPLPPLGTV